MKFLKWQKKPIYLRRHVFEVNMAEKTNALNAYVTGIGSNARIVLWDTTLNKLSESQILFIMAHEMAHYVEKHIYFGIAESLLFSLIGLYVTAKLMKWGVERYGTALKIPSVQDIRSLPLFLTYYFNASICIKSAIKFYFPLSRNKSRSLCH